MVEGVDWWPLLALFLAALLASVTSALTAFGLAIIFHVVLQALFIFGLLQVELTDVVVYILMMGPFTLWPIFILYWKEIDWRLFGLIFPPKVLLTLAGTYLLVSFDSSTLKKILGAILLVFSIWKCYVEFKGPLGAFFTSIRERGQQRDRTRSDCSDLDQDAATNLGDSSNLADLDEEWEMKKPLLESVSVDGRGEEEPTTPKRPPFSYPMIALIVACAIGSGLMGGMFGVSGPPLMIIITFAPLEKGPLYACLPTSPLCLHVPRLDHQPTLTILRLIHPQPIDLHRHLRADQHPTVLLPLPVREPSPLRRYPS